MRKIIILTAFLITLFTSLKGQHWTPFCNGNTNGFIVDFTYYRGDLIACGFFTQIGGISAKYIARWDGNNWNALGAGLNGRAHSLLVKNDSLYVTGYFTTAGGSSAKHIACWNGSNWSTLGTGFNSNTYGIIEHENELVVGGEFTQADGGTALGIARWNGSQWLPMGAGINGTMDGYPAYIHGMTHFQNKLIVGGNFIRVGSTDANGVAQWNGTSWDSLGAGFNMNGALGFCEFGNVLVAGGSFDSSGNQVLGNIASWDGAKWLPLGDNGGFSGYVHTLKVIQKDLYIAGGFVTNNVAPIDTFNHIAKFDGANWLLLGKGVNNDAEPIILYADHLLLGGDFITAGDTTAKKMALWKLESLPEVILEEEFIIYPNPIQTTLEIKSIENIVKVCIYNLTGEKIVSISNLQLKYLTMDLFSIANGFYILEAQTQSDNFINRKFIKHTD
ncbi:MAG: T9SS type A sorting domain-containing protein [Bacteroidota bacterium]|nr:T9SS type A sorting domain-containing protein [Bacteroidota bacterium]